MTTTEAPAVPLASRTTQRGVVAVDEEPGYSIPIEALRDETPWQEKMDKAAERVRLPNRRKAELRARHWEGWSAVKRAVDDADPECLLQWSARAMNTTMPLCISLGRVLERDHLSPEALSHGSWLGMDRSRMPMPFCASSSRSRESEASPIAGSASFSTVISCASWFALMLGSLRKSACASGAWAPYPPFREGAGTKIPSLVLYTRRCGCPRG